MDGLAIVAEKAKDLEALKGLPFESPLLVGSPEGNGSPACWANHSNAVTVGVAGVPCTIRERCD